MPNRDGPLRRSLVGAVDEVRRWAQDEQRATPRVRASASSPPGFFATGTVTVGTVGDVDFTWADIDWTGLFRCSEDGGVLYPDARNAFQTTTTMETYWFAVPAGSCFLGSGQNDRQLRSFGPPLASGHLSVSGLVDAGVGIFVQGSLYDTDPINTIADYIDVTCIGYAADQ